MVKIIQHDDACVPHVFHRNFEKVIRAAYRWLCIEYQDGDRIFAFGERLLMSWNCPLSEILGQAFPGEHTKCELWQA
jgi:hypothetical protein